MHAERWQIAFRQGIAPLLPAAGLLALRDALRDDDPALIQGGSFLPFDAPETVVAACAMALPLWRDGCPRVGDLDVRLADMMYTADRAMPGATLAFVQFFDCGPRDVVWAALLPEVEAELVRRAVAAAVVKGD